MEAIERPALVVAVAVALVLGLNTPSFTSQLGRGWEVTLYILGLVALAAAAGLLAFLVAPRGVVEITQETRERLLFVAFALTMAAILQIGLMRAYAIYWNHKHGQF